MQPQPMSHSNVAPAPCGVGATLPVQAATGSAGGNPSPFEQPRRTLGVQQPPFNTLSGIALVFLRARWE